MYPFTRNIDYLQLVSYRTCEDEGLNFINIREEWHNLDDVDRDDMFTSINTGLTVSGAWLMDGGDESMIIAKRERRAYCRKGKATFTFTGTSVSLRVYVNPLYGKADVRIDGVKPSTIGGVTQAKNVVSSNSYDNKDSSGALISYGEEYIDVTLASNLSDTEHTVELYAENDGSGVGDWFIIAGYKINEYSNKTRDFDCWVTPYKIPGNMEFLTFFNSLDGDEGWEETIYNLEVVFGDYFVDSFGIPMGTATMSEIAQGCGTYVEFYPNVTGSEQEHQENPTIQVTAEYEDTGGVIERNLGDFGAAHYQDDVINYDQYWDADGVYSFVDWYGTVYDYPCGIVWAYGDAIGATLTYTFFGTYIKIQVVRMAYGGNGGHLETYIDDVQDVDISCQNHILYPDYFTAEISGLSNTIHVLKIKAYDGGCDIFDLEWNETRYYTEKTQTVTYNYNLAQIPPFAPIGPRFEKETSIYPTCSPVNLSAVDYNLPRINDGVDMLWLDKRVATFAVCYQAGFEEILKTYDIVIVEPKALTRTIVRGYQDLGIKVLCYQSYGEEVGTWANEWDISSGKVPYTGDGQGVGGYASYYNKGGNQFGECSECKHDRRRLEGVTECALSQTSYYAVWAGRCSNACTKDWRTGYETYILGWNCGGGYNKTNNWSRTASKACTNSSCPQYNAVKGNCPYYESPDDNMYGQDYSVFTSTWPDENGIWKSFYTNPVEPAWSERIKDHYLRTIFGEGVEYTETVVVNTYPTDTEGVTIDGFKTANFPIDADETISVRNIAENYIYARGFDYIFDSEIGRFKMQVSSDAPNADWGTALEVTYTRKGLQADGIFLDTIDTVDVYTSEAYNTAMVDMIGEHHALYSDKIWAMNRGFTILERLMPFTDYVMFETFVTSINWETGEYYEITDPAEIAANQVFIDQLFDLRDTYEFNVLGLNYCDKDDDALKLLIAEKTRQYGWLSWNSEIALNNPQENDEIFTRNLYIESNEWRLADELPLP